MTTGTLAMAMYLLLHALLNSAPLLLFVWFMRHRFSPVRSGAVIGVGLGTAAAIALYRMERFDVFRHGIPAARIMLGYGAWVLPYVVLGWFIGYRMATQQQLRAS